MHQNLYASIKVERDGPLSSVVMDNAHNYARFEVQTPTTTKKVERGEEIKVRD